MVDELRGAIQSAMSEDTSGLFMQSDTFDRAKLKTPRQRATGSGAERILNCSGSFHLEAQLPEVEKKWAKEGTGFHTELGEILKNRAFVVAHPEDSKEIKICIEAIQSLMRPGYTNWSVEQRLPCFGSSGGMDCLWFQGNTCYLMDWKYGEGKPVYALGNPQIAWYACAIRHNFPQISCVHATIVQPRVSGDFGHGADSDFELAGEEGEDADQQATSNISSWTLPWQTIEAWHRKFEAAYERVDVGGEIKAGGWCQFCKASAGCAAHLSYAEHTNGELGMIAIPVGEVWLADAIPRVAAVLRQKKKIVNWFNKAEDFLTAVAIKDPGLLNGTGFEYVPAVGDREWKIGVPDMTDGPDGPTMTAHTEQSIALELKDRGIDPYKPPALISLTAAEKLCNIDDLVHKPGKGKKLKAVKE